MLLAVSQVSCLPGSKKKNIEGLWYFIYNAGGGSEDANPSSFLYLEPDHRYTRDFNKFDYGTWKLKGSELLLTSNQKQVISFPLKKFTENELLLISGKGTELNFERQPEKFNSAADNPFSIENNRWRIPAIRKESDLELRNRLKNHFRFHVVYFKWALNAGFNTIDVRSTPSPLKIYGNGFALKKFEELPDAWRTYFYDKEDCQKANDMIKNLFEKENIAWARTDNRFKMFISAFQQLEQKIAP
jgi:hypothetical protein